VPVAVEMSSGADLSASSLNFERVLIATNRQILYFYGRSWSVINKKYLCIFILNIIAYDCMEMINNKFIYIGLKINQLLGK